MITGTPGAGARLRLAVPARVLGGAVLGCGVLGVGLADVVELSVMAVALGLASALAVTG